MLPTSSHTAVKHNVVVAGTKLKTAPTCLGKKLEASIGLEVYGSLPYVGLLCCVKHHDAVVNRPTAPHTVTNHHQTLYSVGCHDTRCE